VKLLVLLLALASLAAAVYPAFDRQPLSGKAEKKISVKDFSGYSVELNKPAERIVCLLESGLTGLFMLGAQEKVIAVNHYPYQPHIYPYYQCLDSRFAERSIPDVGEGEFVDLERIIALKPDLVIVWNGYPAVIKNLRDRGIPVFTVQLDHFEDIFREMELFGILVGKEQRATELIAIGRQELYAIEQRVKNVAENEKPTVYFTWAESKLDAAGSASTGTQLVALAGGKSVTADLKQEHIKVNVEQVIKWNPDVIISWSGDTVKPERFFQDSQWQSIKAVKNQRVYQLPDAFSCDLWTLKYIIGVQYAAHYLHPDRFGAELAGERARLFKLLYGAEGEKAANVRL